jgi:hypothetical protein
VIPLYFRIVLNIITLIRILDPVFNWRAHEYDYIKIISNKELIYFMKNEKKYKKIILRSDSCDCIRELEEWSVIMNPKLTPILNF